MGAHACVYVYFFLFQVIHRLPYCTLGSLKILFFIWHVMPELDQAIVGWVHSAYAIHIHPSISFILSCTLYIYGFVLVSTVFISSCFLHLFSQLFLQVACLSLMRNHGSLPEGSISIVVVLYVLLCLTMFCVKWSGIFYTINISIFINFVFKIPLESLRNFAPSYAIMLNLFDRYLCPNRLV